MKKQTYEYIKNNSIVHSQNDEYKLSKEEYYLIYSFYVTYSLCANQSQKKRCFKDYGWPDNNIRSNELGRALARILDFKGNENFCFTEEDVLKEKFMDLELPDGFVENLEFERAVVGITNEKNKYLKLFYRIRDGFAHGNYVLRYSKNQTKMVVIQDNNSNNVTARIVLKLDTILHFIRAIDRNNLLEEAE